MKSEATPILIEPAVLERRLPDRDLLIVDLCQSLDFREQHVPGSMHLEYSELIDGGKPAAGLLPSAARLNQLASRLGLHEGLHVVAYDDEGGGWASRLVWTLYILQHRRASVLNGGIHAWINDGHPVTRESSTLSAADQRICSIDDSMLATRDYLLSRLGSTDLQILDARTREEYDGVRILANRGGHIPGAVHFDWLDAIDPTRNLRLKSDHELIAKLSQRNIVLEHEIVVYCQTHHRSAHSWMMLRHLGYSKVRGYAGSWSEWGNDPSTPIE